MNEADLRACPFYFPNATRASAELLLKGEIQRVCIVRPSSAIGSISVSWAEDRIKHSLIEYTDGFYITEVEDGTVLRFSTLTGLLDSLQLIPFNSEQHKQLMNAQTNNVESNGLTNFMVDSNNEYSVPPTDFGNSNSGGNFDPTRFPTPNSLLDSHSQPSSLPNSKPSSNEIGIEGYAGIPPFQAKPAGFNDVSDDDKRPEYDNGYARAAPLLSDIEQYYQTPPPEIKSFYDSVDKKKDVENNNNNNNDNENDINNNINDGNNDDDDDYDDDDDDDEDGFGSFVASFVDKPRHLRGSIAGGTASETVDADQSQSKHNSDEKSKPKPIIPLSPYAQEMFDVQPPGSTTAPKPPSAPGTPPLPLSESQLFDLISDNLDLHINSDCSLSGLENLRALLIKSLRQVNDKIDVHLTRGSPMVSKKSKKKKKATKRRTKDDHE